MPLFTIRLVVLAAHKYNAKKPHHLLQWRQWMFWRPLPNPPPPPLCARQSHFKKWNKYTSIVNHINYKFINSWLKLWKQLPLVSCVLFICTSKPLTSNGSFLCTVFDYIHRVFEYLILVSVLYFRNLFRNSIFYSLQNFKKYS